MPTCPCGFDYVKARLEGRELDNYAVIHDKDYRRVLKKELAHLTETDQEKKGKRLADASQWVGSLMHCPECGAWMFLPPEKRCGDHEFVVLNPAAERRACCTRGAG